MRWAALDRRPPILRGVSTSQIGADHAANQSRIKARLLPQTTLRQVREFHPSNGEIREPAPQSRAPPHGWKVLEFGSSCCLLISRADTLCATRWSGGRLFGKWCIRDDIGKVGGCVPLDISNAEIPNDVVKGGLRLPTSDVAKALFESGFKCQARKFG